MKQFHAHSGGDALVALGSRVQCYTSISGIHNFTFLTHQLVTGHKIGPSRPSCQAPIYSLLLDQTQKQTKPGITLNSAMQYSTIKISRSARSK